jgi:curli biogenesis system outer membrane secretion channel CsgG
MRRVALWLALSLGSWLAPAGAAPPVLAVIKFQDETGALPLQGGAGRVLTNMLSSELAARGGFVVVERQKLRAVLEEQNLTESGLVSPGQGAELGKLLGADYLVTGTVTAFEEDVETRYRGGWFGAAKAQRVSRGGYLAVDLRVIDSSSARIAWARSVEGFTEGGVKDGEGSALEFLDEGPDARAVRAAVLEIIDYLECEIVTRDAACRAAFAAKEQRRIEATRGAAEVR